MWWLYSNVQDNKIQQFGTNAQCSIYNYHSSESKSRTSRVMTTTTSRPVSRISRNYNTNSVIDVRRRW